MPYQVTEKDLDFVTPCAEGKWDAFMDRLEPNVRWWISDDEKNPKTAAGVWTGQEWFDGVATPLRQRLVGNTQKMKVENHWIAGNVLILECRGTAQQTNGEHYNNRYAWFLWFNDNGKIKEAHEYMNTHLVWEVMTNNKV